MTKNKHRNAGDVAPDKTEQVKEPLAENSLLSLHHLSVQYLSNRSGCANWPGLKGLHASLPSPRACKLDLLVGKHAHRHTSRTACYTRMHIPMLTCLTNCTAIPLPLTCRHTCTHTLHRHGRRYTYIITHPSIYKLHTHAGAEADYSSV